LDLNDVLSNVLKLLQPAVERRRTAVRVNGLLPSAAGNETLLGMVFSNLIVNSMKFNDCPRPQIEIGAVSADPPTLYVKDNGIGFAAKHFAEIFLLFRRLHGENEYEGTGAGLAIVCRTLDVHGGRIWLESTPGAGATFYCTLPAAENAPDH
jgi:chemotaxis family two-component system sensor kinase Cph1